MKVFKVICALIIFGFVSVSHAAVIFITEKDANGVTSLLGADNVEVNNKFYNVRFLDGSCTSLFNGCNDFSDFFFGTEVDALAAAWSLLDQVFINGTRFDDVPKFTNGCGSRELCGIETPWERTTLKRFRSVTINIDSQRGRDDVSTTAPRIMEDTTNMPWRTFAVWSKPVEASAPGTAMIMLMGIAGLIVSQRRKQA
jgi:hypothetical protein